MKNLSYLLTTLLVLAAIGCKSSPTQQSATQINGYVTDGRTQKGIEAVNVVTVPPSASVTSDASGHYAITNITAGTFSVTASKYGYPSKSVSVTVVDGKATRTDIVLDSTVGGSGNNNNDVVAYYPLDDGNLLDVSGNNHNASAYGYPTTLITDRHGKANSALLFAGQSCLQAPQAIDLNFGPTSDFTVSCWCKFSGYQSQYAGLVAKGPSGTFYPGYQIVCNGSTVGALLSTNDGQYVGLNSTRNLYDGGWHFITLVFAPSIQQVALYVDGALADSHSSSNVNPALGNSGMLLIGSERNRSVFFLGAIDEVKIYSRALVQNEITALASQ